MFDDDGGCKGEEEVEVRMEPRRSEERDIAGHVVQIPKQSKTFSLAAAFSATLNQYYDWRSGWKEKWNDNAEIWCGTLWEFWLSFNIEAALSTGEKCFALALSTMRFSLP